MHRLSKVARIACLLLALSSFASEKYPAQIESAKSVASGESGSVGNEACARCHAATFESYQRTAMAHASGPAIDTVASDLVTPAEFDHKLSGVHYRIYREGDRVWLSYDRAGDGRHGDDRAGDPALHGKKELLYYIGSGRRGRSYLFETDGFLFESPVNWYANKQTWDMAPAYQSAREIPLNLPAYTSCLHCHVSGMQAPLKGTANRYPTPAFTHNGVSCERCHGPGGAHINAAAHGNDGAIVNPAKLSAARRDEVCMQCHLEGKVAIERAGRHVYEFRPGAKLADYIRYFVLVGGQGAGLGAVSQVEALAQSGCKKKAGDAMWCVSCHDPHQSPAPEERVAYYRGKCLACHGESFAAKHHVDRPDCTACHMPSSPSTDVAHTQVTDHRIPRRPQISPQLLQDVGERGPSPKLVPFPGSQEVDPRDLALAWESLVESGMTAAEPQTQKLLEAALRGSPNDPALLAALGYIEQKHGATEDARELYQRALRADPDSIDAATNLGVIEAQKGHLQDAVKLWQDAFQRAPDRSSIGMNMARAYCDAEKYDEARKTVVQVLEFNPDLDSARKMLQGLNRSPASCRP
ncbi:MAG: tetratricopeptide repeat protein [Candidatus Sulfotelmatobacter sp.]